MLSFDSNILVYANDDRDPARQERAIEIIAAGTRRPALLTQQALGEFCNVTFRKRLLTAAAIRFRIAAWSAFFPVVTTTADQLLAAVELAEARQKQFWDMVIVRVAADAGATLLLTEDIGDGETIAGVRIVNPFDARNNDIVAAALAA